MSRLSRQRGFCFPAIILLALLVSCGTKEHSLHIAVSKVSPNYINWLKSARPDIEITDLYPMTVEKARIMLSKCDGLLLTGGEDVYPGWYGMETEAPRCTGFDRRRDTLEEELLHRAIGLRMPVLGICRGHQLINVYLGGKSIVDIPTDFGQSVKHMCSDYRTCSHIVYIRKNSLLYRICGCDSAMVTSNHHQAAGIIAPMLTVNARSSDGLTEGEEWTDPMEKGFLIGVQWHPERMDRANPLSGKLAGNFLDECEKYSKVKISL
jgi:putative glutamine amidotransferase